MLRDCLDRGYRFLPGISAFSSGTVAAPGHEIVHVTLAAPLPWRDGFARIDRHLRGRGPAEDGAVRDRAPQPCSPSPSTASPSSTTGIAGSLKEWDILVGDDNPIPRTNVAPVAAAPSAPSLYAFAYTVPGATPAPTFIVAGAGETRDRAQGPEGIVRHGDTSPDGMREKARFVMGVMQDRLRALGGDWSRVTVIDIYTAESIHGLLAEEIWAPPAPPPSTASTGSRAAHRSAASTSRWTCAASPASWCGSNPPHPSLRRRVDGVDITSPVDDATGRKSARPSRSTPCSFPRAAPGRRTQVAFSQRFGTLEVTRSMNPAAGTPFARQSNLDIKTGEVIPPEDRRMVYQLANMLWHSDSSFKPVPSLCSLLSARIVPPEGGATEFASARGAYPALPEALTRRVKRPGGRARLLVVARSGPAGLLHRRGARGVPPVRHPLVRRTRRTDARPSSSAPTPRTSRAAGGGRRALLKELLEHVTQPRVPLPPRVAGGRPHRVGQPLRPSPRDAVRHDALQAPDAADDGVGRPGRARAPRRLGQEAAPRLSVFISR